jgi:alpha,alpha-trehalase
MRAEHSFWMAGEEQLPDAGEHRRVVRLDDGSLLNRYWDDRAAPRDESWREDVELAARIPARAPEVLWRDIRAAAESGWDFSSRWLGDGRSLETIRTTRIVPIDLNALLFGLENAIAAAAAALGEDAVADEFRHRGEARLIALERHLWSEALLCYADYDLDSGVAQDQLTGAAAFALFAGVPGSERAERTAAALRGLLSNGGLLATRTPTGQQWDAPNGWAPLQWIAIEGLRRYGHVAFAADIAGNWLAMIEAHFGATGQLLEKYDVERRDAGGGGEYGTEIGFGWTNAVTQELMALRQAG